MVNEIVEQFTAKLGKEVRHIDSILVVDEADNIMSEGFDVLKKLMAEVREYGCGVWLATQDISHFQQKGIDYKINMSTWLIHQVNDVSKKDLAVTGISEPNDDQVRGIKHLRPGQCLYVSYGTDNSDFLQQERFTSIIDKMKDE